MDISVIQNNLGMWICAAFMIAIILIQAVLYLKLSRKEVEAIFTEYGQLYAPVLKISEVMQDEQVLFREMVVDMEYEGMGKYKDKGIPVKMSRTPGRIRSMPPHLGEHTDAILSGLGYTDAERERLRNEGVIR